MFQLYKKFYEKIKILLDALIILLSKQVVFLAQIIMIYFKVNAKLVLFILTKKMIVILV